MAVRRRSPSFSVFAMSIVPSDVAAHEVALEDGALDRRVRRAAVDAVQRLAIVGAAHHPEIPDGRPLQVGVAVVLRGVDHDVAGTRRAALAEDEQRAVADARRRAAGEHLLDDRHALVGIRLHDAAQREQLQLLVVLQLGGDRLAVGRLDFDGERLRVLHPRALGELFVSSLTSRALPCRGRASTGCKPSSTSRRRRAALVLIGRARDRVPDGVI